MVLNCEGYLSFGWGFFLNIIQKHVDNTHSFSQQNIVQVHSSCMEETHHVFCPMKIEGRQRERTNYTNMNISPL